MSAISRALEDLTPRSPDKRDGSARGRPHLSYNSKKSADSGRGPALVTGAVVSPRGGYLGGSDPRASAVGALPPASGPVEPSMQAVRAGVAGSIRNANV